MRLIGAGLPRTATLTQKVALEMLGYAPCYHMVNVLSDLDATPTWRAAFEGETNWDEIFGAFQATVDWPGSFHYKALVEAYPDAKVLLSVRDAESWDRSMRDTIWGLFYADILIRHLSDARCLVDPAWRDYIELMKEMWQRSGLIPDGENTSSATMQAAYDRFNEEVQETVPADRLLVWKPSDGWGPLCAFLEVPVPEAPLPRVNDTTTFADRIIDGSIQAIQAWRAQEAPVGAGT
jgi:hypothetical protein